MTEEPYRWLEAIQNRREYIRDQIKFGTPVFVVSRPEGLVMLGVGHGQSKVFEIYDRHGFAALGHPVDIEKLRQTAIEAAHLEGFNRSSRDVTLRRLISFSLSTTLKNHFEQIFSPPFMVECIFAELGATAGEDILARVNYDGNHRYEHGGVMVAHVKAEREKEAATWVKKKLKSNHSLRQTANTCLTAWQALMQNKSFEGLENPSKPTNSLDGKVVELALLDRKVPDPVHYRTVSLADLKN